MRAIKIMLSISILLNLVLVGCLLALIVNEQPAASESTAEDTSEPDSAESPQAGVTAFHWSQLASTNDYRTYVANLRVLVFRNKPSTRL